MDAVIALIDALPTSGEVESTLDGFDAAEDYDGYEAYYVEIHTQGRAAKEAYDALTDEQKLYVTNIAKLNDLEWLWSAEILANEKIGETLDGDYAYISELSIQKTIDGSAPWDSDDTPGNDTGESNGVVRSFDRMSYTVRVRNEVRPGGEYTYYKEGRLYFEFVLPAAEDKAIFETDAMVWLKAKPDCKYEITTQDYNGQTAQILKGSYLWQPSPGNDTAIGESFVELDIHIRVLAMVQDETLQPEFTFWLEGNKVADGIVTGSENACDTHNNDYASVKADPVKVTSAPRYNVQLISDSNQNLSTFDFSTGNDKAMDKDAGKVNGRRTCYAITLQIYGKSAAHGLRGCEIPDGSDITFDLTITSSYTPNGQAAIDTTFNDYAPLVWSLDHNSSSAQTDGRTIAGISAPYARNAPNYQHTAAGYSHNSCFVGGNWTDERLGDRNSEMGNVLRITISGYKINLNQLPYTNLGSTTKNYTYYNPETVQNYWEVQKACFTAGDLWVVQPFYNKDGKYVVDDYGVGSFTLKVVDSNLEMSGAKTPLPESSTNSNQMVKTDDGVTTTVALKNPGKIDYALAYHALGFPGGYWNEPLTEGCWTNGQDWVTAGGKVGVFDWLIHYSQEEDGVGVAYDQLFKFDPDFFTPDGGGHINEKRGLRIKYGFGVVAESSGKGTPTGGWNHNGKRPNEAGYDDAMKYATADDLIFFSSMAEVQANGYKCVAVLAELRGCCNVQELHTDILYVGTATSDMSKADNVYMVTHSASVWVKGNVAEEAAAYCNKSIDELTDDDYSNYSKNAFPSRIGANAGTLYTYSNYPGYDAETQTLKNYMNFGVNGNNYGSNGSNTNYTTEEQNKGYQGYTKAYYNENGGFAGGTAGVWYGDSCLLVGYKMEINKSVTQTTVNQGTTQQKDTYSMDDGQRWADFQLVGSSVASTRNLDDSTVSTMKTTVYIEDTLPKGLTYVDGSSYYGGAYKQTAEGRQGIVEDGTAITPTVTKNSDGTTTLLYTIPDVTLDMNERTTLPAIYYTCKIGDVDDFNNDVKNGDQLTNTAKIWSAETVGRAFNADEGNLTSETIQVSKLNLGNISKLSDQLFVDVGESMGFTMAIGNSGANARNVCALDILPYHDVNGTTFAKGTECLSEVTELTLKKNTSGVDLSKLSVYYSTSNDVRSKTSDDYREPITEATLLAGGWKKMTLDTTTGTVTLPDSFTPAAILIRGQLDGGQTLGLHLTMKLTDDTPADYVVNRLYESGGNAQDAKPLVAQANTYVVSRSLEGLTWLDFNMDGIQNDGEGYNLSGVQVTLLKLKEGGDPTKEEDYEVYADSIETGKQLNVRTGAVTAYEQGRYKFTELPAGTFAVKFTDGTGETKISPLIASPSNRGGDDTKDSDGIATYNAGKDTLQYTMITGIEMPQVSQMDKYQYVSANHDSGFYQRGYELPQTGGAGTGLYTMGGALLMAAGILWHIQRKRRKEEPASS